MPKNFVAIMVPTRGEWYGSDMNGKMGIVMDTCVQFISHGYLEASIFGLAGDFTFPDGTSSLRPVSEIYSSDFQIFHPGEEETPLGVHAADADDDCRRRLRSSSELPAVFSALEEDGEATYDRRQQLRSRGK